MRCYVGDWVGEGNIADGFIQQPNCMVVEAVRERGEQSREECIKK